MAISVRTAELRIAIKQNHHSLSSNHKISPTLLRGAQLTLKRRKIEEPDYLAPLLEPLGPCPSPPLPLIYRYSCCSECVCCDTPFVMICVSVYNSIFLCFHQLDGCSSPPSVGGKQFLHGTLEIGEYY